MPLDPWVVECQGLYGCGCNDGTAPAPCATTHTSSMPVGNNRAATTAHCTTVHRRVGQRIAGIRPRWLARVLGQRV